MNSLRYPRRKQHVRLPVGRRAVVRWFVRWTSRAQAEIARQFNISQPTVSRIARGA